MAGGSALCPNLLTHTQIMGWEIATGDVNQTRVVSVADLGPVNAQVSQLVTAANYLKDVNATGTLTVADKGITNANLNYALPAP